MSLERVKKVIVDSLGCDEADVKIEASLTDDLGADSLDAVEVIMALEEEFEITIPDDAAESMKTVGDIVTYVENNA